MRRNFLGAIGESPMNGRKRPLPIPAISFASAFDPLQTLNAPSGVFPIRRGERWAYGFQFDEEIGMAPLRNFLIAAAVIGEGSVSAAAPLPFLIHTNPIIDADVARLLGDGYNETDRVAVQRCAFAATQQATIQNWPKPDRDSYRLDLQRFPDGQGINPAAQMRITAISDVRRSRSGVRVSGVIDGRAVYPLYGPVRGAVGDLSFSCYADFSGIVSNLHVTDRR
jgi:hypothetical protein